MMNNQERLELLVRHIDELSEMTSAVRGTEIYPVAFFSNAFDLIGKMQIELHEMEMGQIELFDRQIREHRERIRSIEQTAHQTFDTLSMLPTTPASSAPEPIMRPEPTPAPQLTPSPQPASAPHADTSLNYAIERTKLIDLRKAFTLNDRFRFCRELFDRDEERMNDILDVLNEACSYEESLKLLRAHVRWDFESETAADFLKFIERRFV